MLTVVASVDVTATPSSDGKFDYVVGLDFDQCYATVNVPDRHCLLASAIKSGPNGRQVTVRVENPDGSPFTNQCTVSILTVKH